MHIPKDYFIYVNIVVAIVFILNIFKSYKNGFIYELVNLAFLVFSILCSWFIAPVLANKVFIYDANKLVDNKLPLDNINVFVNTIIWFVLLLLILNVLFLLLKPLLKFFSKIPVLGTVNKILGGIVGIIYGLFITIIISLILTLPIFTNGKEVVDNTVLKYANILNKEVTKIVIKNVNLDEIYKNTEGFNVEDARKDLENWLIEQGVIDG